MEMYQVRYFLEAARTLNFSRAAENCAVSQPALTTAIKKLEGELGAHLFHREGRKILLTDFGKTIMPHLSHIAAEAKATQALAASFRLLDQVPIRLGILATIGPVRLSRFLGEFQSSFPGIDVEVHEGNQPNLLDRLNEAELDLVIINPHEGVSEDYRLNRLYEERYVVIFPPEHRFEKFNVVKLADLAGEPYVDRLACELREIVMQTCEARGVGLYARFRSEREDWVQAMVLANIGFAFMPEYSVTLPGLISRPLVEPEISRTIAVATKPGREHSPAVAAFVRSARQFRWAGL